MTTYVLFTASCLSVCALVTVAVSAVIGYLVGRDRARTKAFLDKLDERAAERRAQGASSDERMDASEATLRGLSDDRDAAERRARVHRRAFIARLDDLSRRYRPTTIAEFKARNALLLSSSEARAEAAEAASMGWANVEYIIRSSGSSGALASAIEAAVELTDSAYVGHGSIRSGGSADVGPVPIDPGVAGPAVGPVPIDPGSRLTPAS